MKTWNAILKIYKIHEKVGQNRPNEKFWSNVILQDQLQLVAD